MYFEDESRFGLFTRNGKSLTARGVKPICPYHQIFQSTYLFGAFSPIDGDSFLLEMPHCNSIIFQTYLNELSSHRPKEYKIIVLDNGAFHKAKSITVPKNIALLFLPPYSPELNPAEKMWAKFKRSFNNKIHNTLDELSLFLEDEIKSTSPASIITTCAYEYIFFDSFWTI